MKSIEKMTFWKKETRRNKTSNLIWQGAKTTRIFDSILNSFRFEQNLACNASQENE